MLPEKINRLSNARVAKLDARNDDSVEFVGDARGAGDISLEGLRQRADGLSILPNGFFPAFLDLPKLARSCLIVRFLVVMIFRIVDLLFAAPGRDVVRIEREDLFVFLKREIVATGVVVTVRITEQLFYVFDFRDEFRTHRSVEVTRLLQMSEQLRRRPAVGIVTIVQTFAQDEFRVRVFGFGDPLLSQFHAAFTKAVHGFVMRFARGHRIGQKTHRCAEFLMRQGKIFRLQGGLAAHECFFASRQRGLSPLQFALRDLLRVLRTACSERNEQYRKRENTKAT